MERRNILKQLLLGAAMVTVLPVTAQSQQAD